jgi:tetraprenyl-beta-curcumene synthase
VGEGLDIDRTTLAFVGAAGSYWLSAFPSAYREVQTGYLQARRIPDPALRELALRALRDKRGNLEGAAAFAVFVRPANRRTAVRALVAYQMIFDYLDTLSEQPSDSPIANGLLLNRGLLTAISPGEPHADYYAQGQLGDDGGYLTGLIEACREALTVLPAFATIAGPAWTATERVVVYQSLNHGDGDGRYDSFDRWARHPERAHRELRWWETGAAAGSTLGVLALIAAAGSPTLDAEVAGAIEGTYFPWIGALASLLDSLADQREDAASGLRGLIDYYASPEETAARMGTIAGEAMRRARELPGGPGHALILAAMTGYYLCGLSMSSSPHVRLVAPAVLDAMGSLARPAMIVLLARQVLGRLAAGAYGRLNDPDGRRRGSATTAVEYSHRPNSHLENQVFDFPLVKARSS